MGRSKMTGALALAMVCSVVSACGSSSSSGNGTSTTSSAAATDVATGATAPVAATSKYATGSVNPASEAVAKGKAAAAKAGGKVTLPKLKVGFLQIAGVIESAQRAQWEFEQGAKALGWSVVTCDAQGDPTKMGTCASNLLNQGVKALFVIGIEPSLIRSQLAQAKAMGVPTVVFAAQVSPGGYTAEYAPPEAAAGKLLAAYVLKQLGNKKDAKIAVHGYPAGFAKTRTAALLTALAAAGARKPISDQTVDASDPIGSAAQLTTTQLTSNPDLSVIWDAFDTSVAGSAQAVATKLPGKKYPNAPLVVGFNANLATQEWMRKGLINAVADDDYAAGAWVALDQAAELFARKRPMDQNPQPAYNIDFQSPKLVTPADLPKQPAYVPTADDYQAFFRAKWAAEFGTSGG